MFTSAVVCPSVITIRRFCTFGLSPGDPENNSVLKTSKEEQVVVTKAARNSLSDKRLKDGQMQI